MCFHDMASELCHCTDQCMASLLSETPKVLETPVAYTCNLRKSHEIGALRYSGADSGVVVTYAPKTLL
jgi:hypothetical protein